MQPVNPWEASKKAALQSVTSMAVRSRSCGMGPPDLATSWQRARSSTARFVQTLQCPTMRRSTWQPLTMKRWGVRRLKTPVGSY